MVPKCSKLALIISDDYLFDFTDQLMKKNQNSKIFKGFQVCRIMNLFLTLCISARRLINRTQPLMITTPANQIIQAPAARLIHSTKRENQTTHCKPDFDVVVRV